MQYAGAMCSDRVWCKNKSHSGERSFDAEIGLYYNIVITLAARYGDGMRLAARRNAKDEGCHGR
jgi:hypothetical protein